MKKTIKKVTATTLSIFGVLSVMPSAFCEPYGEDASSKNNGECYSAEISQEKQSAISPEAVTDRNQKGNSKNLVHELSEGSKNLFYLPYSFDANDFWKILKENNVCENKKINKEWNSVIAINSAGDTMKDIYFIFKSGSKKIIFSFNVCSGKKLHNVRNYIELLYECSLRQIADLILTDFHIPEDTEIIADDAFDGIDVKNIVFNGKTYDNVDDFMRDFNAYRANHK